ncbi:MAG TPA: efflux transporter outer membrane subunit [Verrucomicrobiae bacterium]|nr:efflux transporter outer membrane subunit [Verrucomicrobiae bacterium]
MIGFSLDIYHSSFVILPLSLVLLLASCAVGPNYKRPPVNAPADFRSASGHTTNSLAELPWWQMFQDNNLQDLIRTALTNSYDLRIAISRVEQANAILVQNRASFFPQLGYAGTIQRNRNAVGGNAAFTGGITTNFLVLDANVSWELDLWGRIRRLNESARAQFLATQEARRDVMISVISRVAQAYFQLLAFDRQLEIAKRTTNSYGESLRIFSLQLSHGVASKLETSSAEAALASAAATIPDLERQITIQENMINVLVGHNPGPVPRSHTLLQQLLPPEVPAGLPATLLERRPDIREAEQLLRSANAQVGVAVADYFPRLTLTGLLGKVSPEVSAITSGAATAWSIAANLSGPIFQGGRLAGQYRQAQALREQYLLQYRSTILNAFAEISDALIANQKFAQVRVQQARAVDAYRTAVQIVNQRYLVGQSSYYEVLQEQLLLFPAENSLVQTELNQLLTLVQLYQALGGGWQAESPAAPARKH